MHGHGVVYLTVLVPKWARIVGELELCELMYDRWWACVVVVFRKRMEGGSFFGIGFMW